MSKIVNEPQLYAPSSVKTYKDAKLAVKDRGDCLHELSALRPR